jgi:2-iminobutanoate/2-iminopropanoate deaminase
MRAIIVVALVAVTACAPKQDVEFRPLPNAPGPFSDAVRVGNILFLSGAIGTDSAGRVVPGGIGPETRQTLENIRASLARNGLTMDNVVKCTAMLVDIKEWPAMNEVYRTFFPGPKPARSAFAGTGLALNARVEIECIAAIP